jgi:hypothetical protein
MPSIAFQLVTFVTISLLKRGSLGIGS